MWDFILPICKVVGSAVAIVSGVFGILFETHDEVGEGARKRKKLNRAGWTFLCFTLISGLVALLATLGEIFSQKTEDQRRQKQDSLVLSNLQSQSGIALKSLDSIQHIVTRFDSFKADATFDLPLTNPALSEFASQLLQSATALGPSGGNGSSSVLQVNGNDARSISSISFGLNDASLAFLSNGPPSFHKAAPLLTALRSPVLTMIFDRSNRPPADIAFHFLEGNPSGEFSPGASWGHFKGEILYRPKESRLQLLAMSDIFSREQWVDWGMIASLWDLGSAHCYFAVADVGTTPEERAVIAGLRPSKLVLKFDQRSLTLTNFTRFEAAFGSPAFHAQLPDRKQILNSRANSIDDVP